MNEEEKERRDRADSPFCWCHDVVSDRRPNFSVLGRKNSYRSLSDLRKRKGKSQNSRSREMAGRNRTDLMNGRLVCVCNDGGEVGKDISFCEGRSVLGVQSVEPV